MKEYVIIFFRIITIMPLLLFTTIYVMGKRPIGELPVFDFLTLVILGAVVGADIADPKIKHLPTVFAIFLIAFLQYFVSKYSIKYRKFGKYVNFEPTLIMQNGKFLVKNLKRIKYSIDEVLMMLREKDIFDFKEVHYAVIEANGRLTVLKKSEGRPLTPQDMGIQGKEKEIPTVVILEGKINQSSVKKLNLSKEMILEQAKRQGFHNLSDIFIATYTKENGLFISPYSVKKEEIDIEH